jgi:hypothetical protein
LISDVPVLIFSLSFVNSEFVTKGNWGMDLEFEKHCGESDAGKEA